MLMYFLLTRHYIVALFSPTCDVLQYICTTFYTEVITKLSKANTYMIVTCMNALPAKEKLSV